jgi:hypothetical protein
LKYADEIDIKISWAEALKESFHTLINGEHRTSDFIAGAETSIVSNFKNSNHSTIQIKNEWDIDYAISSTINNSGKTSTITSRLPRVLTIKKIELTADLEELIYQSDNQQPLKFVETYLNYFGLIKSLRIPFTNKIRQKTVLHDRHINIWKRFFRFHYNNLTAHIYPFGELMVHKATGLTFLPEYAIKGFNDFEADLYIGLTNISPGQSISLLFEIANETAEQSELEAKISWYFLSNNEFVAMEKTRILDSTNNFLQSGLVQLSLPENATNQNTILTGDATYWLVARCDTNYEVVANIKAIKTNGLAVTRLFDVENQEAKKSVAAATIENIYPKTIKAVSQNTASQNGREIETDRHFFWRSANRLRHKQRAINQWDYEQIILEKFSNIYKVKCLNHAFFEAEEAKIFANATHTLITLTPHFLVDASNSNFQPAIALSKLLEVKAYLQSKTTAFAKMQVLNNQYDEVQIELEAMLNNDVLDLLFYREKLNEDLKKFLSPWAFENTALPTLSQKIYLATLVDYIDELPYVHHIKTMKILKNGLEVFDEIEATTPIHILTSAGDHLVTVIQFAK